MENNGLDVQMLKEKLSKMNKNKQYKNDGKGVPIIIVLPNGQPIPMSSLEMAGFYFSELLSNITGENQKYIDYKMLRHRLSTKENEFLQGPLKGHSFYECISFEQQRAILFEYYFSIPMNKQIAYTTWNNSLPISEQMSNRVNEQESNRVSEQVSNRISEQENNRIIEQENNRIGAQPRSQPNTQTRPQPRAQSSTQTETQNSNPGGKPVSECTAEDVDIVFSDFN